VNCLVTANDSVSGATYPRGGAFYLNSPGGVLSASNCVFLDNVAGSGTQGSGGGAFHADSGIRAVFHGCAFISNTALSASGGAIGSGASGSGGAPIETRNCTFFGNRATGAGQGGAISIGAAGLVSRHFNATIVSNQVLGGLSNGGGMYSAANTTNYLYNSLIAGNSAGGTGGKELHAAGGLMVATNCLILGSTSGATTNGSIVGQDPLVCPPANNGGPTPTCALLWGSPCIGAANPATALPFDQRGYARDAQPDMGAYEYGATAPRQSGAVLTLR
jgi:hypothetical protein